ncbi:MAG: alpha/beta fold hydrolase [Saprospiraceae bacterium]|nr:alpha/beta fold hydrolase [Saprospiraceae bacterium]
MLKALQKRIIFQPTRLPENYVFQFDLRFEEFFLTDPVSGLRINALFFPAEWGSGRQLVLYFHGNAGNLQRWGKLAADFIRHGYDFFVIDYPGYGKSPGKPTEEGCYHSAQMAYSWALERYASEWIIIYGRSLGSAMASWLAAHRPARQLILETPFPSMAKLIAYKAPRFIADLGTPVHFPVEHFLQRVPYPKSVFQGTHDWIVPYKAALELKPWVGDDRFFVIEGGGHKNLNQFDYYHEKLVHVLEK